MQRFYYVVGAEQEPIINENGIIYHFDAVNFELARQVMIAMHSDEFVLDEGEEMDVIEGQFADCWKMIPTKDVEEYLEMESVPFAAEDMIVEKRGSYTWLTPRDTVYMVTTKRTDLQ